MNQTTPGGSEIFHHEEPSEAPEQRDYDDELRMAITAHIGQFVPGEPTRMAEIVSGELPLDVLVWAPTAERPVWTLVTAGMAAFEMPAPEGAEDWARCELVLTLPADWPMPSDTRSMQEVFSDEANFWPIRALKAAARLPYSYQTWLSYGHTLAAGEDPADTYEGSPYSGLLLGYPQSLEVEALRMDHRGDPVTFWGVYPLHPVEMEFKLEMGADATLDLFENAGLHEGVFTNRPPLIEKEIVEQPVVEQKPSGLLGRLFGKK